MNVFNVPKMRHVVGCSVSPLDKTGQSILTGSTLLLLLNRCALVTCFVWSSVQRTSRENSIEQSAQYTSHVQSCVYNYIHTITHTPHMYSPVCTIIYTHTHTYSPVHNIHVQSCVYNYIYKYTYSPVHNTHVQSCVYNYIYTYTQSSAQYTCTVLCTIYIYIYTYTYIQSSAQYTCTVLCVHYIYIHNVLHIHNYTYIQSSAQYTVYTHIHMNVAKLQIIFFCTVTETARAGVT